MTYLPPSPPMIAARHMGGAQDTVKWIVLHSTVGPTKAGSAKAIANFFHREDKPTSAHYVVDAAEVFQCVPDHRIAYHCGYNTGSIGVEMCDYPDPSKIGRWDDADHKAMLQRTVGLVAQLCLAYDIPPVFLSSDQLKAGQKGITTHALMSTTFHKSTHWDPGAWPKAAFMQALRTEIARLMTVPTKEVAVKSQQFSVTLANIKSNPEMPQKYVEADMRTVAHLRSSVSFGSEIAPKRYKEAWTRIVGPSFGNRQECPIHVGPHWKVTASALKRRVLGFPKITPTRYDTIVEAHRAPGFKLAFIATHTVSEKDNPRASMRSLRVRKWNRHIRKTRRDIAALNARGVTVVIGGDLNDHAAPTHFTDTQVNLVNQGLMQLTVCPAPGVKVHKDVVRRVKGHTDHPIIAVKLTLEMA